MLETIHPLAKKHTLNVTFGSKVVFQHAEFAQIGALTSFATNDLLKQQFSSRSR
jgi:hypothetical protein